MGSRSFKSIDSNVLSTVEQLLTAVITHQPARVSKETVSSCKRLLKSVQALPAIPTKSFGFTVSVREGDEHFSEMKYWSVSLDDHHFEVSQGGSVYEKLVGGDNYSITLYSLNRDGECEREYGLEGHLYNWQSEILLLLSSEEKYSVEVMIE